MSIYKKEKMCELLKPLGEFRYDDIDTIRRFLTESEDSERKKLKLELEKLGVPKKDADNGSFFERLSIEFDEYLLSETHELSHELVTMALYKKIELRIHRILTVAYPYEDLRHMYRHTHLKKFLGCHNISLMTLLHYNELNELRHVNNSIKHGGVVSGPLSKFPGWQVGGPLENLDKCYERISLLMPIFVEDLVSKVESDVGCYTSPSPRLTNHSSRPAPPVAEFNR